MTVLVQQTITATNVWTRIFTTPGDGTIEFVGVRCVNNGQDSITLQLASTPTNVAPNSILYNIQPPFVIEGYGGAEDTNIGVMPGACLWALANSNLMSVHVTGVGG